jgi:quinol monooxygenase YgiN
VSEIIHVIATIQARPGRGDAVAGIVSGELTKIRAEEGCLRYDFFRVRRQPDEFVMVEEWSSRGALRAHGAGEHYQATSARLAAEIAEAPVVRVLDAVVVDGAS